MLKGVEDTALYPLVVFYKYSFRKLSCHYTVKLFNLQILSPKQESCSARLNQVDFFFFFVIKEICQPYQLVGYNKEILWKM